MALSFPGSRVHQSSVKKSNPLFDALLVLPYRCIKWLDSSHHVFTDYWWQPLFFLFCLCDCSQRPKRTHSVTASFPLPLELVQCQNCCGKAIFLNFSTVPFIDGPLSFLYGKALWKMVLLWALQTRAGLKLSNKDSHASSEDAVNRFKCAWAPLSSGESGPHSQLEWRGNHTKYYFHIGPLTL